MVDAGDVSATPERQPQGYPSGDTTAHFAEDFVAHVRGSAPDRHESAVLSAALDAVRACDAQDEVV